jgi:hypothetical protein
VLTRLARLEAAQPELHTDVRQTRFPNDNRIRLFFCPIILLPSNVLGQANGKGSLSALIGSGKLRFGAIESAAQPKAWAMKIFSECSCVSKRRSHVTRQIVKRAVQARTASCLPGTFNTTTKVSAEWYSLRLETRCDCCGV